MTPDGAVHAHDNMIWPPNNKMVNVVLSGHVKDELSIIRDDGGIGISSAYLLINGLEKIILRDETVDLLDEDGSFTVDFEVEATKNSLVMIDLHASDTNPDETGGPNSGLVDSTYIRIPNDMDNGKSEK